MADLVPLNEIFSAKRIRKSHMQDQIVSKSPSPAVYRADETYDET